MRAVVQRVSSARVTVEDEVVGQIDLGLLVLVGVTHSDTAELARALASKVAGLRIFDTGAGDSSVLDVGGEVLVVSQFTLYADTRRGRRPSWSAAAPSAVAEPLVTEFIEALRAFGLSVRTGRFGADMQVASVNAGPMTVLLDID